MRSIRMAAAVLVPALATILPTAALRAAPPQEASGGLRVSNVVAGTICLPGEGSAREAVGVDGAGEICEDSQIRIRGFGRCVFDGDERPCTWFGFAFDYEHKDPDEPITCVWTRPRPMNEGNPDEVVERMATTGTFTLDTGSATSGRYRHAMYQVYQPFPAAWLAVPMDVRCTYRGEQVLETSWQLIFSSAFR